MAATWGVIVVALGLVTAAAAAGVAVGLERSRRQMESLLSRVTLLEKRMVDAATTATTPDAPPSEAGSPRARGEDVLVGWTSRVNRILTRAAIPQDLAEQALVGVYNRISDPVQPSDLADELSVSLRTLERGLGRSLGCSPRQLILTLKMREARRMLETGHFCVGEVAHHLAFADAAHFSRRYRRFYRCPPSLHRPAPNTRPT